MEKAAEITDQILVEILPDDDEEGRRRQQQQETAADTEDPTATGNLIICGKGKQKEIDILKYIEFVRDPSCGAIATFEGTTRDHFQGKEVVELRYEAYIPMALRQLRSICNSALSTFTSLRKVAVVHRLGIVPVAQGSVFIAASALHRADAIDASRYVIDQLKASVPIWKKEVYADGGGESWKRNSDVVIPPP